VGKSFTTEQLRWLRTVESQIKANAGVWLSFEIYHFTEMAFAGQGGYQRARQVFGSEEKLDEILVSLNAAVFPESPGSEDSAPEHASAH